MALERLLARYQLQDRTAKVLNWPKGDEDGSHQTPD